MSNPVAPPASGGHPVTMSERLFVGRDYRMVECIAGEFKKGLQSLIAPSTIKGIRKDAKVVSHNAGRYITVHEVEIVMSDNSIVTGIVLERALHDGELPNTDADFPRGNINTSQLARSGTHDKTADMYEMATGHKADRQPDW